MITIQITKTISEEVLENIFVTALEGGSNYWFDLKRGSIKKVRELEPEGPLSEAMFRAIMYKGLSLEVIDAEDDEDVIGELSLERVIEGIKKISNSGDSWALENELNSSGDANSSDVVFQYIVLGDAVYG